MAAAAFSPAQSAGRWRLQQSMRGARVQLKRGGNGAWWNVTTQLPRTQPWRGENAAAGSWLNSAIELRERRFELVEQAAFGVAELANG